jgi:hypothetical protein
MRLNTDGTDGVIEINNLLNELYRTEQQYGS